jgi:hypothetical protein
MRRSLRLSPINEPSCTCRYCSSCQCERIKSDDHSEKAPQNRRDARKISTYCQTDPIISLKKHELNRRDEHDIRFIEKNPNIKKYKINNTTKNNNNVKESRSFLLLSFYHILIQLTTFLIGIPIFVLKFSIMLFLNSLYLFLRFSSNCILQLFAIIIDYNDVHQQQYNNSSSNLSSLCTFSLDSLLLSLVKFVLKTFLFVCLIIFSVYIYKNFIYFNLVLKLNDNLMTKLNKKDGNFFLNREPFYTGTQKVLNTLWIKNRYG